MVINFGLLGNLPILSLNYFNASLTGNITGNGFLDIPTGPIPYGGQTFNNITVSHSDVTIHVLLNLYTG